MRITSALPSASIPIIAVDAVPKKTGNTSTDALLAGNTNWWHDSAHVAGTPTAAGMSNAKHALTYSFMQAADSGSPADNNGFQPMNARTQQAVRDALAQVAAVADLTFTQVDSGGNIAFGTNKQNLVSAGYSIYPNSRATDSASLYIANDAFDQNTTDWSAGTSGFATLLHEIGHALGLKHPGPYNAGGGKTPGPYLSKALDNTRFTQMSYNAPADAMVAQTTDYGNGVIGLSLHQVKAQTYGMGDIAALQYLYGRSRTSAETGARTYAFSDADANTGEFLQTLTNSNASSAIDASGVSRNSVVDLRAGHYSSIGLRDPYASLAAPFNTAKGWAQNVHSKVKPTYTGQNNLGIAAGSHIDNAQGGSGNDVLTGNNDAANSLAGNDGNDTFFLGQANTTIDGGNGTDTVCLPKMKTKWNVQFDGATGTYTCTNGAITDVLHGVETVKGWNGSTLKAAKLY